MPDVSLGMTLNVGGVAAGVAAAKAEFTRLGAAADKASSRLRELGKDSSRALGQAGVLKSGLSDTLSMQTRFWRDYMSLTGRGWDQYLRATQEGIDKQAELYRQAGVDELALKEWVDRKKLDIHQRTQQQLQLEAAQKRLRGGEGSFGDGVNVALGGIVQNYTNAATQMTQVWGNFFTSFTQGFANSVGQAVVYSNSLGDALGNVARTALSGLISGFVNLGIQMAVNAALGQSIQSAAQAQTIALGQVTGLALAEAYGPAAAFASLASFGGNAAPAIAGIVSTTAVTKALGGAGLFKSGGYTGDMPADQIAGVVHGREFVFDAPAVSRIGVGALEALRAGTAFGNGPTGGGAGGGSGPGGAGKLVINIENQGAPKDFDVQQLSENEVRIIARDEARSVVRKEAPGVVAGNIANPNSEISKSLSRNLKSERRRA